MLIILIFFSKIWFNISNQYRLVLHNLCDGNRTVCMHRSNSIRVTFVFGVLSLNTPFNAEDFVSYFILVRDTSSILSCVVALNLLVFVFCD